MRLGVPSLPKLQRPGMTQPPGPSWGKDSEYRYWAFISYSQKDRRWAEWLHRRLETYRVPKLTTASLKESDAIPARLFPVFRDRDELPVSADLGAQLRDARKRSRNLVVVCSPHAASSRWRCLFSGPANVAVLTCESPSETRFSSGSTRS